MKKFFVFSLVVLTATAVLAHPHFRKTTSVTLPGDVEASVAFFTVPSNMSHAEKAENGAFLSPGLPKLKISTDLKAGSASIPAGTYTVGAIKNSMTDWTMVLSPGELGFGDKPDMSKLIKLDSQFNKGAPVEHLVVDIFPGSGKAAGKVVVLLGFGDMWLDGVLTEVAE